MSAAEAGVATEVYRDIGHNFNESCDGTLASALLNLQQPRCLSSTRQSSKCYPLFHLLMLACLCLSEAFTATRTTAFETGSRRTFHVPTRRVHKRARSVNPGLVLRALDLEAMLDMEWMPVMEDLQKSIVMSTESSGVNQTDSYLDRDLDHVNSDHPEHSESDNPQDVITKRALKLALLKRRTAKPTSKQATKYTSVGERRIGRATATTHGAKSALMETIRNRARGNAAATGESSPNMGDTAHATTLPLSSSVIHETVAEMLRKRSQSTFSLLSKTMGILGEPKEKVIKETSLSHEDINSEVSIRLASAQDDMNIASLRLSVFSAFPPDIQNQFRARSCQAIHQRRLRGAVCVVATVKDFVVGSAECSFDEFNGTRLGQRRLAGSMLYVTEVAVNPSVRRRGIAHKLLQAIDQIAVGRGIESLYLHVEVKNEAALRLYEKAGYQLAGDDPMFHEFTKSLNLHPGATKGREHFLLCKEMSNKTPTWLPDAVLHHDNSGNAHAATTLGFEIPA